MIEVSISFAISGDHDPNLIKDQIGFYLKPLLDMYHTGAKVNLKLSEINFHVEGLWNG